jgi:hypothetical protein
MDRSVTAGIMKLFCVARCNEGPSHLVEVLGPQMAALAGTSYSIRVSKNGAQITASIHTACRHGLDEALPCKASPYYMHSRPISLHRAAGPRKYAL